MRRAQAQGIALLSVDVFDTLLLRGTRPEFLRFADVAIRQDYALAGLGLDSPGPERLLASRLRCTRSAYQAARCGDGAGEVVFASIVAAMLDDLGVPVVALEPLRRIEIEFEKTVLRGNRRLAAALGDATVPVVAISDTPLAGAEIRELLDHTLPGHSVGHVFASSDMGLTKRDGALFRHVCQECRVAPAAVLHLGDHPWSDLRMARQQGLAALMTPRPLPWRLLHGWRAWSVRRRMPYGADAANARILLALAGHGQRRGCAG